MDWSLVYSSLHIPWDVFNETTINTALLFGLFEPLWKVLILQMQGHEFYDLLIGSRIIGCYGWPALFLSTATALGVSLSLPSAGIHGALTFINTLR